MRKISGIILCGLLLGQFLTTSAIAKDMSIHSVVERAQGIEEKALGRFSFAGLVEAELDVERNDTENASDIVLETAALGVNVDIVENVTCDFLLYYEEDDTEHIDEGFITVALGDAQPLSLSVGKMYIPFGKFESHFVSDPLTLKIGEINQGAASVTFANEVVEITGVIFNGDVEEVRDDDLIGSFALHAAYAMPGDTLENFRIIAGISLITNIANSDGLEGEIAGALSSPVAGFNVFTSVRFMEKFFLEIEYLGALNAFEAGELTFDDGNAFAPKAWNLELAMAVSDAFEIAAKYEGGKDLGNFLPEDRFGVAASWSVYQNTWLAAEYLHSNFEIGGKANAVAVQLAVQF